MVDFPSWMELVSIVHPNFPLLELDEELEKYKQVLIKNINRKSAISVALGNEIVGVLLFSYKQNCLSCMAVHPKHRKNGIATAMIDKMLSVLATDRNIWVMTFRDNDEKGAAPRALYKKFGFVEGELVTEHGYPHQKFILYRDSLV